MQLSGFNFIGSQISALGKSTFQTFNPWKGVNNEQLFYAAIPEEVELACELATSAFISFRKTPSRIRAEFLKKIAISLDQNRENLIDIATNETGLTRERLHAEISRTMVQLETFAETLLAENWEIISSSDSIPDRLPTPKPSFIKKQIPLGPIVVFGASNFPFAYSTIGGDTASALAVGCPVVVKSHPLHAGTSECVAQIILKITQEMQLPEGVFSHLNDDSYAVGQQLVANPAIKAIGFTGSIVGGTALMQFANQRSEPIPVFAEMGSLNPVCMLLENDAAKIDSAAEQLARSFTSSAGQFCTKPGIIIGIEGESWDEFVSQLILHTKKQSISNLLHPSLAEKYETKRSVVTQLSSILLEKKATKSWEGTIQISACSATHFIQSKPLQEEVFGPFTCVISCRDFDEMTAVLSTLKGQLTCSIFSKDTTTDHFQSIIDWAELSAGRICLNSVPTGVEVTEAMHHGGPFPASSDSRFTAVGSHAMLRWIRPVSFQNF